MPSYFWFLLLSVLLYFWDSSLIFSALNTTKEYWAWPKDANASANFCSAESYLRVVNCPTRWSLFFIFVFLCWSYQKYKSVELGNYIQSQARLATQGLIFILIYLPPLTHWNNCNSQIYHSPKPTPTCLCPRCTPGLLSPPPSAVRPQPRDWRVLGGGGRDWEFVFRDLGMFNEHCSLLMPSSDLEWDCEQGT